jgi:hypothetical protein
VQPVHREYKVSKDLQMVQPVNKVQLDLKVFQEWASKESKVQPVHKVFKDSKAYPVTHSIQAQQVGLDLLDLQVQQAQRPIQAQRE